MPHSGESKETTFGSPEKDWLSELVNYWRQELFEDLEEHFHLRVPQSFT